MELPLIRKISVGPDYKNNAMHYYVGQPAYNDNQVTHITCDAGIYYVWITGKDEVKLWKMFENMPISCEFDLNFDR